MKQNLPSAHDYAAETVRYPAMDVVDIQAVQSGVVDAYRNQVLLDVNSDCMRLSVFEGQYRWHMHPDTDELFLVAAGELRIEFEDGAAATLTEWQSIVVPAGVVHRTRAVGRTVNVTFEKQNAQTIFVDSPSESPADRG